MARKKKHLPQQPQTLFRDPADYSPFALSHCRVCAAGWTRENSQGQLFMVCLLDRYEIMPNLGRCDRYERDPALKIESQVQDWEPPHDYNPDDVPMPPEYMAHEGAAEPPDAEA